MTDNRRILCCLIGGLLVASCSTRVTPAAVAWNEAAPHLAPPAGPEHPNDPASVGYLRVETDTDVRVNGSLSYDNIRRPFDLYSAGGELIRADVDNHGGRNGEEPISRALPPGRYTVASVFGATYRKVQVEISPGATTEVPEGALREAPAVFPR